MAKAIRPRQTITRGESNANLLLQVREAIHQFRRGGLVCRWCTSAGRREIQTPQQQSIVLGSDSAFVESPARCSAGKRKRPDASPVNCRPVRFEPCAPGARPTARMRARWSPKPGTGLPQYSESMYARRRVRGNGLPPLHQAGALAARNNPSSRLSKSTHHSTLSLRRYALNCLAYRRANETVPEESGDRHRRRRDSRRDRHEGAEHAGGEAGAASARALAALRRHFDRRDHLGQPGSRHDGEAHP